MGVDDLVAVVGLPGDHHQVDGDHGHECDDAPSIIGPELLGSTCDPSRVNVDERWMREALEAAAEGLDRGELPIGAVVVLNDELVSRAHTEERTQGRLLMHAELLALDEADRRLGHLRPDAVLYTTLEPCLGCLGAAMSTMVGAIVFGLSSPSDGAAEFATAWDRTRTRGAAHTYRSPTIHGGVLDESRTLFEEYVSGSTGDNPMATWARTLLDESLITRARRPDARMTGLATTPENGESPGQ